MYIPDVTLCQATIRKYLAVKTAKALKHDLRMTCATVIQTRWRGHVAIQRYIQCLYFTILIQSAARSRIVRIQCRQIIEGTTQPIIWMLFVYHRSFLFVECCIIIPRYYCLPICSQEILGSKWSQRLATQERLRHFSSDLVAMLQCTSTFHFVSRLCYFNSVQCSKVDYNETLPLHCWRWCVDNILEYANSIILSPHGLPIIYSFSCSIMSVCCQEIPSSKESRRNQKQETNCPCHCSSSQVEMLHLD